MLETRLGPTAGCLEARAGHWCLYISATLPPTDSRAISISAPHPILKVDRGAPTRDGKKETSGLLVGVWRPDCTSIHCEVGLGNPHVCQGRPLTQHPWCGGPARRCLHWRELSCHKSQRHLCWTAQVSCQVSWSSFSACLCAQLLYQSTLSSPSRLVA